MTERVVIGGVLAMICIGRVEAQAPRYEVTHLDSWGQCYFFQAYALDNQGLAAGAEINATCGPSSRALVWDYRRAPGSTAIQLEGTTPTQGAEALDISNGRVTGSIFPEDSEGPWGPRR